VYLWRDDDAVTLIDTGEAGSGPAIADALRQIGLAPTDIDRLVLTHFHDDHAGSAAEVGSWGAVTGPALATSDRIRSSHGRFASAVGAGSPRRYRAKSSSSEAAL
jgi:glyoxylase-like metal-dependent hydrolase (beta-lactamase superfamily II)